MWHKNDSLLKPEEWEIYDDQENSLGILSKISSTQALLRQFLTDYCPTENSILTIADHIIATYKQTINPFCYELMLNFKSGAYQKLDRRLGIAVAIVLAFQSNN